MKRNARYATAVVLGAAAFGLLGTAPAAFAQDLSATGDRDRRSAGDVSLDIIERPLKDVIAYIQDRTDTNLILSQEAEGVLVTVKVKNLPWREALEVVAERAGCQLDERSANLIRIEKPPRVSFDFDNADVRIVIKAIADIAGANIVVGREVEGSVTLSLHNIPWQVALDTIIKTLGYTIVYEDLGILRIVSPASIKAQLETQVFRLKWVRPQSPYRAIIETEISESKIKAVGDTVQEIEKNFNILVAFEAALAPEGSVTYIKETNSLIATGTAPALTELERLIARIDIEPAQVFVDVKFINTTNEDFLDIGVNPGENGLSASMSLGKMLTRLPFSIGSGGFEDSLTPGRAPDGSRGLPLPVQQGDALFDSLFSYGTLDFSSTNLALNLIKTDSKSRLVQAPKLVCLDNQEASIFVGETIRFAQTIATSNQSGGLEFSISEADSSPVQTGFQLLMIPHVIPDRDQVMMTVIPQQRALTGTSAEQPGFDTFKTGAGGTTGEQQISLPRESNATVVTHVKLNSGETAVIGGLLTDIETHTVNKVPFLGDIPVLGYLFRGEQTSNKKNNLIIFITPTIIRDVSQMKEIVVNELRNRKDRIESELLEIYGGDDLEGGDVTVPPAAPNLSGPK